MVLWEITLGTAYFLGLKRTYKLALQIQRRLIKPEHQKVREFAQRKTRAVFDVVLNVHQNIQQRDLEVGRNLGNWILRWLDRMKPSAEIRPLLEKPRTAASISLAKQVKNLCNQKTLRSTAERVANRESSRRLFWSRRGPWLKPFPTIAIIMRQPWTGIQYRQYTDRSQMLRSTFEKSRFNGVFRDDIMQWTLQN